MSKLLNKIAEQSYETRLEYSNIENINVILDAKLEATSPQRVVDYISLSLDNINSNIERMKEAKKELDSLIKAQGTQKEIIKNGCAGWLSDAGVKKLDGDIVSSVSIYSPKPKETLKVINEESLINQGYFKTVVDKTAVKNAILDGVTVDGAEIEILHDSDTLKVNKRRISQSKISAS